MRIVTYSNDFGNTIKALTLTEFRTSDTFPENWDEFVWQDQPSKQAAIARHDYAFKVWAADNEAGLPIKETY